MRVLVVFVLSAVVCLNSSFAQSVDLRAYYKEQSELLLKEFKPPVPGTSFPLSTLTGKSESVTLYALSAESVTVVGERGRRSYKRNTLDMKTRALLFAPDYAEVNAAIRTRERKAQADADYAAANPDHVGSITVRSEIDRSSEKEVENNENGNFSRTTKTKSQTYLVDVTVSNFGAQDDTYELFWYFICHDVTLDGKEDLRVASARKMSVTVPAGQRVQQSLRSNTLEIVEKVSSRDYSGNINSGDETRNRPPEGEEGSEFDGYAVFLTFDGEILDKKASSSKYLTDEWQQKGRAEL